MAELMTLSGEDEFLSFSPAGQLARAVSRVRAVPSIPVGRRITARTALPNLAARANIALTRRRSPVRRRMVTRRAWSKVRRLSPAQRRALIYRMGQIARSPYMMHGNIDMLYGSWLGDTFRAVTSPVRSVVKGATHGVMEVGRGISRGDLKRVVKAPFKAAGHTVLAQKRDYTRHLEHYWRPSKMRKWMKPVGSGLMAAGAVPTPASPFLLAAGGALNIGGAAGEAIHKTHKARQAARAQAKSRATAKAETQEAVKKSLPWIVIGGVGLIGGILMLKG